MDKFNESLSKSLSLLKTRKFWIELLIMTLGMGVGAFAVHFFLVPSKLIVGSITGLSIVISTMSGIPLSVLTFVINLFLLVMAFLLIGKEFGAKTVYTGLVLSPWLWVFEKVFPLEKVFPNGGSLMNDSWFDLLCFVLILSVVQSILFKINASTGGLDIIGKIINKYTHIDLGKSVSIGGALICCSAFLINPPRLVIIGLLGTWLNGLVITYFYNGFNTKKRVHIVSKEHEKIRKFIIEDIVRGATIINAKGGYTGDELIMIESILNTDEYAKLLCFLKENNISSFVTVDEVYEVYGKWITRREKKEHSIS